MIGSPQLLLLSGIGPAAELAGHGIEVVVDLPGRRREPPRPRARPADLRTERPIDATARGSPRCRRTPSGERTRACRPRHPAASTSTAPCTSRGMEGPAARVHDRGDDRAAREPRAAAPGGRRPRVAPLIDPATYSCRGRPRLDARRHRAWPRARGTAALAEWGAREVHPGPGVDDDALDRYVRERTLSSPSTRSAPARWASTRTRSSTRGCACAASRGCASPTLDHAGGDVGQHARAVADDRRARRGPADRAPPARLTAPAFRPRCSRRRRARSSPS